MLTHGPSRDAIRRRSGCANCKRRRKKCDEKRPECLACVRRGIKCGGYDRPIVFKDVSQKAAESSRKFEAARWAELKLADQKETQQKPGPETGEKATTPVARPGRDDDESDDLNNAIEHVTTCSEDRGHSDWLNNFDCLQEPAFDMTFDFLENSMPPSTPGGQAASLLGPGRPAPDVSQSRAQINQLESCRLPVDPDLPSPVQVTTRGDGAATSSYLTPVEEPPAFDSQAHLIRSLADEEAAVNDSPSPHDALPQQQVTQRLATCLPGGVLGTPLMTELSHSPEELLALVFQEQVTPRIPVDLEFSSLFNASRSFRAAALALSASSMELLQGSSAGRNTLRLDNSHETPWFYYKAALHELEQGLAQPRRDNVEEIASTYLLLAYHDMEVDSPLGVRYYASLIDEMASGTDLETFMTPGLFKAWRMLRCERKFLSMATRATTSLTDAWEPCSLYDHQLAIKDILVNVWKFHSRYAMEASFTARSEESASKQAAGWLQAALNRECDHQQAEEGDFNEQSLDAEAVLSQCDSFDKQLDQWHCMLPERDLPVPKVGSFKDIVTGPSFDPVVAYRLPDEDKAINYVMYLLARMTSSFLRSHFDQSCSAMVSETLGRTALGIFCGMNLQKRYFSMLRLHNLLLMIVLLGEGVALSSIVVEHLIPRALARPLPPSEKALWILLRTAVTLIAKQSLRDGYLAGDEKSSRVNDGKLLLKVSDVTTLVSVSLVVIKIIAGSWSAIVLWACGRYMLSKSNDNKTQTAVSSMIQWKVPPGVRSISMIPRSFSSWNISILTLVIMIQAFTAPILTGSVNWNVGFSVSQNVVSVASIASRTGYNNWYWYNAQGSFDKKGPLRTAAGYANLEWADPSTIDSHGKSITGNGCRHLFGNDGLPPDSILIDAVLPCIDIHDIHWIRSEDELTGADWDDVDGDDLTLVDDTPLSYYHEGVAMVFNSTDLRRGPNTTDSPPPPYLFSGTRIVTLMLGRYNVTDPPCSALKNTIFGDVNALGYHRVRSRVNSVHENCYLIGRVNFTAGVTASRRATYLTPRVVEDQTAISHVKFEPNSWVHEAIWLLPDLMTMLSVMNASQLPTYGNVDGHVGELLRQGYLAAWGMLAHGYGQETETYKALPAEGRLVADVSFPRVFAWLGLCLLMTGWGALALGTTLGRRDLQPPQDVMESQAEERSGQARGAGHTFLEWCFNRD